MSKCSIDSNLQRLLFRLLLVTIPLAVAGQIAAAGTGANAELPDMRNTSGELVGHSDTADSASNCGNYPGPGEVPPTGVWGHGGNEHTGPDGGGDGRPGGVGQGGGDGCGAGSGGASSLGFPASGFRDSVPHSVDCAVHSGPGAVDSISGTIVQSALDVKIASGLGGWGFSRSYRTADGWASPGLVGERWHASSFVFVDDSGAEPVIVGLAGHAVEYVYDAGSSTYLPPAASTEWLVEDEETVGGSTYKVWKLVRPYGNARTFYRAHAGGGGVTATPDELEGLPLRDYDGYGNEFVYSYTTYGTSTANPAARLDEIEVKRADGTLQATVEFTWQDDDALANPGKLTRLSVYRPDGGGETETNRVLYTYKESSDGLSDALGTESDLIQVERYIRLTNSTGNLSTWRRLVTQYRYHGGEVNETSVDTDGDGYIEQGSAHQIKMVLSEEQIEFFAQEIITQVGAVSDMDDALDELLTLDDGDTWYFGAGNKVVDLAEKLVSVYETTGDRRVIELWTLSACGCSGGATQGVRYEYDYWDYASGGYERTVRVIESVDDGTGSMVLHRTHYIDLADFDPGVDERLYAKSFAIVSGSKEWAGYREVDSLGRETRRASVEAVSSYTQGTSTTAPSISVSTSDGIVIARSYVGDSPYVSETKVANGLKASFGDYTQLSKLEWDSTRPWLITKKTRYSAEGTNITDADEMQVVDYIYGFHGSSDGVAWIEVKSEAEKESENGPTGSNTYSSYALFDTHGQMLWHRAADGLLARYTYDAQTGVRLSTTMNSNTGPSGSWGTPSLSTSGWAGAGDELKSEITVDLLGRAVSSRRNVGTSHETESFVVYEMRTHPDLPNLDYYATVSLPPIVMGGTSGSFVGPASVSWRNAGGRTLRSSEYVPVATSGGGGDEYDLVATSNSLGTEIGRSVSVYTINGVVEHRRAWHDVANDKYAETSYEYDEQGRIETMTDPDGTITRYSYDVLDRTIKTEVGTVASGGSADMVTVSENFYDSGGTATQGVGDGRVTLIRQHVDGSTMSDTEFEYDYRSRRTKTLKPTTPHSLAEYDNLDRVVRTAMVTSASPTTIDGEAANRISLSETFFSERGKPYKSRVAVDPTQTGGSLEWQESHNWFDERGRSIASWSGGAATKTEYDALGRVTKSYVTDRRGDAAPGASGNHADASSVTGDVVLQETEYSYITDTNLVDLTTSRARVHDALVTDTGALSGLASAKKVTTYTARYYDNAGRPVHTVAYGTNTTGFKHGGTAPTVNQASPPSASTSGLLMSSVVYDDKDGSVLHTIAPDETITRTIRDDMGRTIAVIENYDDAAEDAEITGWNATDERWSVAGVGGGGEDVDRMTTFTYTDGGKQRKRIAHPTTDDVQETEYVYGPQDGAGLLKSYNTLIEVRYPDTTVIGDGDAGTDPEFAVTYKYNRLGQQTEMIDQNGTTHAYTYDGAGRMTKDEITAFGTDVDQWVDSIEISYDSAGRREYVRSKDSTTVENAVQFAYDARGRLEDVVQDPDSDIGGGDDLTVSYTYDDEPIGSGNRSRLGELTYPDGSIFVSKYGSAGSVNDLLSRQEAIQPSAGGANIVEYEFIGAGMMATTTYGAAGFILDRTIKHNGERPDGEYPGYDQFGRVIRHVWADDTIAAQDPVTSVPTIPPVIELEMAYDKSSNRTRTIDARPGARRAMRDEVYAYDGLDRLTEAERGEWGGSSLSNVKGSQEWALDALGNWETFKHDTDADGDYDGAFERQRRTHNEANEYTEADYPQDTGSLILDNDFDDSGNMSKSEGEVSGSAAEQHLAFDGWNRLVEVEVGSTPQDLSRYAYNGLNWRTEAEIDTDANGVYDQKRQMYYDSSWRLLEERIDNGYNGIDVYAQQLWGLRYIDDSVFRREGTWNISNVAWGTPIYDLTGPMFSVLARMSEKTGALKERVRYRAYGEARHQWGHDVDGDGDADSTDSGLIATAAAASMPSAVIGTTNYFVDADLDRDGIIDAADMATWSAIGSEGHLALGDISSSENVVGRNGATYDDSSKLYLYRRRWLDVELGRWQGRDPAGYIDGSGEYQFVRGNPNSNLDPSGAMSISVHGKPVLTASCGGSTHANWSIILEFVAPCDGYLVIENHVTCASGSCDGGYFRDQYEFYEAWEVSIGSTVTELQIARDSPITDVTSLVAPVDTYGTHGTLGVVRFYCEDVTGNLEGAENTTAGWERFRWYGRNQCRIGVGGLLSTPQKPRWWNAGVPIGVDGHRDFATEWLCCDGCDQYVTSSLSHN